MPAEAPLLDSDLEIREALPDDAHAIAALCMSGTCLMARLLRERSPTVDEMRKRIQTVRDNGLPWLVARVARGYRRLLLCHFLSPASGLSLHPRGIDIRGIRNGRTRHRQRAAVQANR